MCDICERVKDLRYTGRRFFLVIFSLSHFDGRSFRHVTHQKVHQDVLAIPELNNNSNFKAPSFLKL